jgi:uncharacterized RDD family membrane protein YckC
MTASRLITLVLLPSVVFALAYEPVLTQFSKGLVSPYAKADVRKRWFAAAVDGFLIAASGLPYLTTGSVLYPVVAAAYLLFRDSIRGQSAGKWVAGLVVIALESGRPCGFGGSLRRNALLLLPGANFVAMVLEARSVLRDPQGQRLGDRLAQTQVVEGLGAKDLVKSFQDSLAEAGTGVGRRVGRPGRAPVRP